MSRLYGGVDGGASKTLAIIVNEEGVEIGRGSAGGVNLQMVGTETALARVQEALIEAYLAANIGKKTRLDGLVMGLAGLNRPVDFTQLQTELSRTEKLADNLELCSDFDLVLYELPEQRGLGIIAGNGSIALGQDRRNKKVRSGGWGHFFGDEGSGMWLGRQALNAAARSVDRRGPKTLILDLILKEWNLSSSSDLFGAVYGSGGATRGVGIAQVAQLAEIIFKAAAEGDDVAKVLVQSAVTELVMAIKACDTQLFFDNPPMLAVAGGLLINHQVFLNSLIRRLEPMMTLGGIVRVENAALVAARAAETKFL